MLGSFRSHLTRFFTGSEDERIVDACECPMFVVRHRAPLPEPGQTLLVPFDGAAFRPADAAGVEAVATLFQTRIHLLHYTLKEHRTTDEVLERTRAMFPSELIAGAHSVKHRHYQHYDPLVDQACSEVDAPLLVVPILRGSNGVSYKLLHDLILNIHVPICLLRGPVDGPATGIKSHRKEAETKLERVES